MKKLNKNLVCALIVTVMASSFSYANAADSFFVAIPKKAFNQAAKNKKTVAASVAAIAAVVTAAVVSKLAYDGYFRKETTGDKVDNGQ